MTYRHAGRSFDGIPCGKGLRVVPRPSQLQLDSLTLVDGLEGTEGEGHGGTSCLFRAKGQKELGQLGNGLER